MKLLEDVASAKVTWEQLVEANEAVGERHKEIAESGEPPAPGEAMFVILGIYGRKLPPDQVSAILFRMQALGALIKSKSVENWSLHIEGKDHYLVPETLFKAAAEARLLIGPRDLHFDPVEFLELALRYADEEGRA
jgi:hypothetical protein